jgi:hypothetical protein
LSAVPKILLHHSEGVDPTLVQWLQDEINHLFGFQPATIVLLIGIVIALFPLGLFGFMWWQRRRAAKLAE